MRRIGSLYQGTGINDDKFILIMEQDREAYRFKRGHFLTMITRDAEKGVRLRDIEKLVE
jgi:hypothetical protein